MKIKSLRSLALTLLAVFAGLSLALAADSKTPAAGDQAPLISGQDQNGKTWDLSRLIGKQLVLMYC